MKIAIDSSPLESGHKVRGVGFYLTHLRNALERYHPEHTYYFFKNPTEIPQDADVVHYLYFDPFSFSLPLHKKYKTVVTAHDLTPLVFPEHFPSGMKGKIRWQFQKFALQHVDAVITDSEASKKDINTIASVKEEKIKVVHLAAGEEFQKIDNKMLMLTIREKYNLPEKFVLYVGDVTWNKNLPRLIDAIKESNLTLVMVGKNIVSKNFDKKNPWNADLVAVQAATKDDKRFIKLGFVEEDELVPLYNSATVCAFPSLYEGFGLPVLEAMQSGCPVVTTKEGSLEEIAGDAAYYVDAYDASNIANGISEVYFTQKLRADLIAKGFIQAKKYNWKKTAEQTISVYKSIV